MVPEDYCCRVCHGFMYVPDGLDPLDEDVRFCGTCAIDEIERLRGQVRWVVQLESGCWLAPWGGDPGRTCDIKNAQQFDTKALAEEALVQARTYREFSEASIYGVQMMCELTEADAQRMHRLCDLICSARKVALEHRTAKWYTSSCDELLDELADELENLCPAMANLKQSKDVQ